MKKLITYFVLPIGILFASLSARAEPSLLGLVDSGSSTATLYAPADVSPPALVQAVDAFTGPACCFRVDARARKPGSTPVTDDLLPSKTFRAYALQWVGPGPKPAPSVAAALPKQAIVHKGAEGRYTIQYGNATYGLVMCTTSEGLRTTLRPLDSDAQRAPHSKPIVSWYYYLGYDTEATCQ